MVKGTVGTAIAAATGSAKGVAGDIHKMVSGDYCKKDKSGHRSGCVSDVAGTFEKVAAVGTATLVGLTPICPPCGVAGAVVGGVGLRTYSKDFWRKKKHLPSQPMSSTTV